MYEELSNAYPGFKYFYEVNLPMTAAMNLCARLSAQNEHVVQYGGRVYYTANRLLSLPEFSQVLPA
jgi:hypothetical protein